jgi:uncharacterized protein (DUF608 family)
MSRQAGILKMDKFFAIRAQQGDSTVVRASQTVPEDPFEAIQSLKFRYAFPFGWNDFADEQLPDSVLLEACGFLIPMDLKNSAIPSAVFRDTVKNTSGSPVKVSLLAAQQNAVGFNGHGRLTLRELVFDVPSRHDGGAVMVKNGGVPVSAKISFSGSELRIVLNQAVEMKAGDELVVEFQ